MCLSRRYLRGHVAAGFTFQAMGENMEEQAEPSMLKDRLAFCKAHTFAD